MKLKIFICCLLCWMTISLSSFGQDIKLRDISKITLTTAGSFVSDYYREVEVLPENGRWNCYRTKLAESHYGKPDVRDSSIRLIKTVSSKLITDLLTRISNPDTTLNLKLFHITAKELVQHIDSLLSDFKDDRKWTTSDADSLDVNLTEAQKVQFSTIIKNEPIEVRNAILTALNPFRLDDRTSYRIVISHKNLKQDTIAAYANLELYHLPWRVNKHYNYDPRLAELFELLSGNENYIAKERNRLCTEINRPLYQKRVKPQIVWANFKAKKPVNFAALNNTLIPSYIVNRGNSGFLTSSLLPSNFEMWFGFMDGDTLNTVEYNMMEKYMVDFYYKGNFLIDYVKARPTYIARFFIKRVTQKTINQITTIYPAIAKFKPDEIQLLFITGDCYQSFNFDKRSSWLLLPDGAAVLINYTNGLINSDHNIFVGFTERSRFHSRHQVCIIYDKSGRKIAGDESRIFIDLN